MMRETLVALPIARFAAGLIGCEQKQPAAAEAGSHIDEAAEKVGEPIEKEVDNRGPRPPPASRALAAA